MVGKAKTIEVTPGSETARLLDEADRAPLILDVDGARYRVQREDAERSPETRAESSEDELGPEWGDYDPERVIQVLEKMAGTWAHRDIDDMIDGLYRARLVGTRPPRRPEPR